MLSKCLEYFDKHSSEKTFLLKRGVKATWKGLFACFNYPWISIGGFIFCCYKKAVFRSWKDYQLFKKKKNGEERAQVFMTKSGMLSFHTSKHKEKMTFLCALSCSPSYSLPSLHPPPPIPFFPSPMVFEPVGITRRKEMPSKLPSVAVRSCVTHGDGLHGTDGA